MRERWRSSVATSLSAAAAVAAKKTTIKSLRLCTCICTSLAAIDYTSPPNPVGRRSGSARDPPPALLPNYRNEGLDRTLLLAEGVYYETLYICMLWLTFCRCDECTRSTPVFL